MHNCLVIAAHRDQKARREGGNPEASSCQQGNSLDHMHGLGGELRGNYGAEELFGRVAQTAHRRGSLVASPAPVC